MTWARTWVRQPEQESQALALPGLEQQRRQGPLQQLAQAPPRPQNPPPQ